MSGLENALLGKLAVIDQKAVELIWALFLEDRDLLAEYEAGKVFRFMVQEISTLCVDRFEIRLKYRGRLENPSAEELASVMFSVSPGSECLIFRMKDGLTI